MNYNACGFSQSELGKYVILRTISLSVSVVSLTPLVGADHLTFDGVMGGFRKKMSCRLISGGKTHAKKFLGKNILH